MVSFHGISINRIDSDEALLLARFFLFLACSDGREGLPHSISASMIPISMGGVVCPILSLVGFNESMQERNPSLPLLAEGDKFVHEDRSVNQTEP